jgi:uridine phosphorylase
MSISPSELILNEDGSIYHLNLCPGDIGDTIITVGDPERVSQVSHYFDEVTLKKGKREFLTHTGTLNGKKLTVLSTGIGTDNIDIVLNELDALANVDFGSGLPKENRIRFKIIRLGTSGAIQPDIPLDSFVMTEISLGFDGLLHHYENHGICLTDWQEALMAQLRWDTQKASPYGVSFSPSLGQLFASNRIRLGITATKTGFYGPQGRRLRLNPNPPELMERLRRFRHNGRRIDNLEMETSGIYAMAKLLGHDAVSLSCILANRATGSFSKNPAQAVDELIKYTLLTLAPIRNL